MDAQGHVDNFSVTSETKGGASSPIILGALDQFGTKGYVKKLRTSITQESLPSNKDGLLELLCNQIQAYI